MNTMEFNAKTAEPRLGQRRGAKKTGKFNRRECKERKDKIHETAKTNQTMCPLCREALVSAPEGSGEMSEMHLNKPK